MAWVYRAFTTAVLCMSSALAIAQPDETPDPLEGYSRQARGVADRLIRSISKVETYSAAFSFTFETGDMPMGAPTQKMTFVYERPNRFRIGTDMHDMVSDGKQLTVYAKNIRRYKTEKLKPDIQKQLAAYTRAFSLDFGVESLFLAKDPRKLLGDRIREVDVAGDDTLDGERCTLIEGVIGFSAMGMGDAEMPITLWLRRSDTQRLA